MAAINYALPRILEPDERRFTTYETIAAEIQPPFGRWCRCSAAMAQKTPMLLVQPP